MSSLLDRELVCRIQCERPLLSHLLFLTLAMFSISNHILGVVPMISLLNQHMEQLMRLEPNARSDDLHRQQERAQKVEIAESKKKGSIAAKVTRCFHRRNQSEESRSQTFRGGLDAVKALDAHRQSCVSQNTLSKLQEASCKMMQSIASQEMRSIYGVAVLALLSVLGVTVIALILSWNALTFELRVWKIMLLQISTVVFQVGFVVVAVFVWDASTFIALIDFVFCIIAPFADWFWCKQYQSVGKLAPIDVARYCLLTGYMTGRFWDMTVRPRHSSWKRAIVGDGASTLERLELVWVSRSSALVSEILPIIDKSWSALVRYWGDASMCRISIYVTDKDEAAKEQLQNQIEETGLYQTGAIHFCRPKLAQIIESHTLDLIHNRQSSSSVLAFCGSPVLSQKLHQDKISNDMLTAMTGNKKHQMEFVSESYGGAKNFSSSK